MREGGGNALSSALAAARVLLRDCFTGLGDYRRRRGTSPHLSAVLADLPPDLYGDQYYRVALRVHELIDRMPEAAELGLATAKKLLPACPTHQRAVLNAIRASDIAPADIDEHVARLCRNCARPSRGGRRRRTPIEKAADDLDAAISDLAAVASEPSTCPEALAATVTGLIERLDALREGVRSR